MSKFTYKMTDKAAILAFKKGFMGVGVGNIAILKDKGNEFVLGAPLMTVNVKLMDGVCTTKGSKLLLATVDTKIEIIKGFTKVSDEDAEDDKEKEKALKKQAKEKEKEAKKRAKEAEKKAKEEKKKHKH